MKKLITICAVVGLIVAVAGTAQAALDIDLIFMTSVKEHLDGTAGGTPWGFEIWFNFDDPDTLHHIDVTLSGGGVGSFTINEDFGYWEYGVFDYSSLGALQSDYPAGDYTFSFEDSGNDVLNSVTLDYTGLSSPLNRVDFINPSYDGETGISTTPTFTWTVDSGDGDALGMWLFDPDTDDDIDENFPVSMDTTSWEPLGPLDPAHTYDLEVSVFGAGATVGEDTVGDDTFEYALAFEYLNEIEFTTVPEPATIALLGLGGLLLRKRRDRKQSKK